jgi:hypothetical protein
VHVFEVWYVRLEERSMPLDGFVMNKTITVLLTVKLLKLLRLYIVEKMKMSLLTAA